MTLEKGTTAKTIIYGKETYSNVGSINVEGPTITYESSNSTVATVNSSGVVTPVKPSTTPVTITVRSSQYKQYAAVELTYNVTVNKGSITLNFIPESVILNQGENITPYINFSGAVKSYIDENITVTTSNATIASLQSPAYQLHSKIENDVEKAYRNIVKVQNIIAEFRNTLDFKYPVAKDFDRVYEYLERRLVEANMTKDKEIMEEVVTHIRSMRDTWKEVMKRAKMAENQ